MKYIKYFFCLLVLPALVISCGDFDDDNLDFSNSVNPYVEFNSPPAVTAWAGQNANLPVSIRSAIQRDLTVFFEVEGDNNLESEIVLPAASLSAPLVVPSLGDGIEGQSVVSLVGVDDPDFTIGRGNPALGLSVTEVSVTWIGPTAVDDNYITPFETILTGNVGANDNFPEGSTFVVLTSPSNGGLEMEVNGSFTFTPDSTFSGMDMFTYQLCLAAPNQISCDTASVSITVEEEEEEDDDDDDDDDDE